MEWDREKPLLPTRLSEEFRLSPSMLFLYLRSVCERGGEWSDRGREKGEEREEGRKVRGTQKKPFPWELHRLMTLQNASADGV